MAEKTPTFKEIMEEYTGKPWPPDPEPPRSYPKPKREKDIVEKVGTVFIVIFIVLGIAGIGMKLSGDIRDPLPRGVEYSEVVCDDAKDSDYSKELQRESINVELRDGCFSGWIALPTNWETWNVQMLKPAPDAWIALRYWGQPIYGPLSAYSFNTKKVNFTVAKNPKIRVEGKGTFRIYRTMQ